MKKIILNFLILFAACQSLTSCIFAESYSDVIYNIDVNVTQISESITDTNVKIASEAIQGMMVNLSKSARRQWMDSVNFEDYSKTDLTASLTYAEIMEEVEKTKADCEKIISDLSYSYEGTDNFELCYTVTLSRYSGYDGSVETLEVTAINYVFNK